MTELIKRYVALIRGINVGGNSIIKMTELKSLFESAGLTDVVTYIQSGNVLFSTKDIAREPLVRQLEGILASAIGKQVKVFVLTQAELEQEVAHNPFDPEGRDKEQRTHLMFLSAEPDITRIKALLALQGREYQFHIHGKVIY